MECRTTLAKCRSEMFLHDKQIHSQATQTNALTVVYIFVLFLLCIDYSTVV